MSGRGSRGGASGAGGGKPAPGQADAGAPFNPAALPPSPDVEAPADAAGKQAQVRSMPAPGSPLPEHELERLKRAAEKAQAPVPARGSKSPAPKRGQSDPAA